jgi:tetratricopeptide (TPR) repeat protein
MTDSNAWQALWSSASVARTGGRLSQALRLFSAATAAGPPAGEPYAESARLNLEIARGLAGVGALYARHCHDLGLPSDACPAYAVHQAFVNDLVLSAAERSLQAVDIAPEQTNWLVLLADALERAGNPHLALAYRRRAGQKDPAGSLTAADHPQRNPAVNPATRGPSDPATATKSETASACADQAPRGGTAAGALTPGRADVVLSLVRVAAATGRPGLSDGLRAEAADLAVHLPDYCPAHLAAGHAALAVGDRPAATKCFATAAILSRRSPARAVRAPEAAEALASAHAFLSAPVSGSGPDQPTRFTDQRLVDLACARELAAGGDIFEALRLYGEALAGFSVPDIPLTYELYKGYKILRHAGTYYAIPSDVRDFRIIDGVVCRLPPALDQARLALPRVPRWLINSMRGVSRLSRWVDPHGHARLRVRHVVRRIGLGLVAVPGVKVAASRSALVELIDRVPERRRMAAWILVSHRAT